MGKSKKMALFCIATDELPEDKEGDDEFGGDGLFLSPNQMRTFTAW